MCFFMKAEGAAINQLCSPMARVWYVEREILRYLAKTEECTSKFLICSGVGENQEFDEKWKKCTGKMVTKLELANENLVFD